MAGTRRPRSGLKAPLTGAALRKAIMAIWCVGFCGMQWRAIGLLCDIPFSTLYTPFSRWTRVGPAARPAPRPPGTGLRRYGGPEHGGDRQPLLPLGTELLHARHRRRQED